MLNIWKAPGSEESTLVLTLGDFKENVKRIYFEGSAVFFKILNLCRNSRVGEHHSFKVFFDSAQT
jgi:hypothetical protein